jgi:photosystem II stability/assembly factor-like uncharacterized protein
LLAAFAACSASAQFEILDAKTTASLRGIDALSAQVAWASGSGGTVLLTTDGGGTWKHCAAPPKGEKLDFRGVQGFDAQTAVIMASGKGPASAIYKTTDGCDTWKMVFADPDADGFFDALRKVTGRQMYLMGDQVGGKFSMFYSADQGSTWYIADDPGLDADKGDGGFAASNSGMISIGSTIFFATGGGTAAHVYNTYAKCAQGAAKDVQCPLAWAKTEVPMAAGSAGAGVFSLAGRTRTSMGGATSATLVAVGGDYQKPDASAGTAAVSSATGKWAPATTFPHGYRSAVVFQSATQSWIAVGPNGCDVSKDDGKNWTPLLPGAGDAPDADKGWNAISLPFAVGAKGKVGRLKAK